MDIRHQSGMDWQCNWRVWHWPWWDKTPQHIGAPHKFDYVSNFAGFGPFQFHWYSSK